ncbi:hypothetical protein CG399_00775, partial [Bifidobacteriaceae bacterium NR015]
MQQGESATDKAKKEAKQAIEDAKTQKSKIDEDVNKAESEASDANSEALQANKEVTEAQTELDNKKKEVQTAEEEKGKADKELSEHQTAVDKANEGVKDKRTVLDQETANQTAAENKLKATQKEKDAKTTELGTANEDVQTKTTEQTKAGEKVKTETGNLQTANTQLEKAKQDKNKAQEQANQLSATATEKEKEQTAAEQAVNANTEQQEKIQKEIDNLNAAGSGATNADVQELEKKANEAKQAYEEANTTATQKAQEAKNKKNDLDNAGNNLNSAEKDLENNPDVKKLSDAEKAVEAAKKAADAAAKKDTSKTTANFAGFLDYVIETYKNSTSKEDKALLEDAQRAKQILNGKRVEIMKQVQNKGKTENVLDRVIEVPMWYKDLVKLGKVGGADSLQNMKEAATYYDSLNKLRKEDSDKNSANTEEKKALGDVNVRLSLIAESIVNSFYSGANHDHAINHPGYEGSEVMETTPYKTAENLAWGNYDGDSTNHKDQEYSKCYVTVNGNTSCSTKYGEKYNALSGWYTVEKERYDKAVAGTFVTGEKNNEKHKISDAGKEMLKQHRYDLRQYMWQHPEIKLFVDDADNSKLKDIFLESVGHYTNFASKDITAGGFAESDLSLEEVTTRIVGSTTTTKEDVAGDVAVWHGSNESSISVAEYKKLLSNYENSLKQEKAAGSASENTDEIAKLQKLNAEANKANYDLFVK